jgi:hypothetical protein
VFFVNKCLFRSSSWFQQIKRFSPTEKSSDAKELQNQNQPSRPANPGREQEHKHHHRQLRRGNLPTFPDVIPSVIVKYRPPNTNKKKKKNIVSSFLTDMMKVLLLSQY